MNGLNLYLVKCLITPLIMSVGVVLFVYVLFYHQVSFVNSAFNILISENPQSDQSIYNQVMTPIIGIDAPVVEIKYPQYGDKFAELSIDSLKMKSVPVFNCDDYLQLGYGWGRSFYSRYPGEGGKILLAGHLYTNSALYNIKIGSEIVLKTTYGTFRYSVTQTKVVNESDSSVMAPDDTKEQLVMYTCYPYFVIGHHTQRFVVISSLKSGPIVKNIPFK